MFFLFKVILDESFISQFLSPKIMRDFRFFTVLDDDHNNYLEISAIHNEEVAAQVRKYWDIGTGPIKDLQYLLEKNGIIVTGFDTNEDKIDAFSQRTIVAGNDIYFIAVALGNRPEGRIRFDMAHELGHILLHPWSEDLEAITKDEFKARERQANMFASAFLLPRDSFGKDILEPE